MTDLHGRHAADRTMDEWYHRFAEELWLLPDSEGAEEAAFIREALDLRAGQRVLDAPCGAGRVAVHLARAGCRMTGIDLQKPFVDRAAARFRSEGVAGRFLVLDLRQMDFAAEFDGAYSWLGSFGYFTHDENADVLDRYVAALRPGGRLLVDQPNREALLRHFRPSHRIRGCVVENRWNRDAERVESDWVVDREGVPEHNRLSIRLYTPGQMQRLFGRAGLRVEAMYGSRNGEPYTRSSRRLIVVGRK